VRYRQRKRLAKRKPDEIGHLFEIKRSKKPAHYYSKSLQSYLCENKTVKGGLLWELPLSVYSDWEVNLTNTR
jgi:hypothetical protein